MLVLQVAEQALLSIVEVTRSNEPVHWITNADLYRESGKLEEISLADSRRRQMGLEE